MHVYMTAREGGAWQNRSKTRSDVCIPIVNRHRDLVGWTDMPPNVDANRLRHREA